MKKMLIAVMLLATPAVAAEVDFSTKLIGLDGAPFVSCKKYDAASTPPKCIDETPVTLGALAVESLNTTEQGTTPEDLVRRGQLAIRISGAKGKLDLSAEEIKTIKDLILKRALPVAAVRAIEVLDPASLKK